MCNNFLLNIIYLKKEIEFQINFDINILRHSVHTLNDFRSQMLWSRRSNETSHIFVERTRLIRPTI